MRSLPVLMVAVASSFLTLLLFNMQTAIELCAPYAVVMFLMTILNLHRELAEDGRRSR